MEVAREPAMRLSRRQRGEQVGARCNDASAGDWRIQLGERESLPVETLPSGSTPLSGGGLPWS